MQTPITLPSGAKLQVGLAAFDAGNNLLMTVARELLAVDINIDTMDLSGLTGKDLNVFKNAVFRLIQSREFLAALQPCLDRCLYNDLRLTKQTFEPAEARQDYLQVVWEVTRSNLRPFFAGLDLLSLVGSLLNSDNPKPELTPTPSL